MFQTLQVKFVKDLKKFRSGSAPRQVDATPYLLTNTVMKMKGSREERYKRYHLFLQWSPPRSTLPSPKDQTHSLWHCLIDFTKELKPRTKACCLTLSVLTFPMSGSRWAGDIEIQRGEDGHTGHTHRWRSTSINWSKASSGQGSESPGYPGTQLSPPHTTSLGFPLLCSRYWTKHGFSMMPRRPRGPEARSSGLTLTFWMPPH